MSAARCPREDELLDALGRAVAGAELDAHVATCPSCSELRLVAGALLDERVEAISQAPVPSAGTMLWRMHMRHRQEAHAVARRSLLVGQAVTLAIAIALMVALFGPHVAVEMSQFSTPLLFVLAASVLLAPIAGYVAIRQK
jgi:predicted anti-sigma-YlaC factor YlaD